jgi:hypothetical protein
MVGNHPDAGGSHYLASKIGKGCTAREDKRKWIGLLIRYNTNMLFQWNDNLVCPDSALQK